MEYEHLAGSAPMATQCIPQSMLLLLQPFKPLPAMPTCASGERSWVQMPPAGQNSCSCQLIDLYELLLFAAQAASPLASFMDKTHPQAPALLQHAAQWQTCTTASCKLSSAN